MRRARTYGKSVCGERKRRMCKNDYSKEGSRRSIVRAITALVRSRGRRGKEERDKKQGRGRRGGRVRRGEGAGEERAKGKKGSDPGLHFRLQFPQHPLTVAIPLLLTTIILLC
jgi:hypothetical protein